MGSRKQYLAMGRNFFIGLAIAFFIFAFFYGGKFLSSPQSIPRKSDLIVILGGDGGARTFKGIQLYTEGYGRKVLLTGLEAGEKEVEAYYLNWRAQILVSKGVPKEQIIFDDISINSWDEAVNTLALMKSCGWSNVIVVTDPPHLRRLNWVWSKVFKNSGFEYDLVSSSPSWWNAGKWWDNEQSGKFVIKEYIKILYYFFKY